MPTRLRLSCRALLIIVLVGPPPAKSGPALCSAGVYVVDRNANSVRKLFSVIFVKKLNTVVSNVV